MSYVEMNNARRGDVWYLDSGCSNHMCGDKNLFCDLNEEFKQNVKLGNNTCMVVLGKGSVKLTLSGITHVVREVFFVPELKNNLLSIGQLQERGLTIVIQHGKLKVYHPEKGLIIQTRMTTNRMFMLCSSSPSPKPDCLYTSADDLAHLWHCRYGHLSYKGLRTLQFKNMVQEIPQFKRPSTVCSMYSLHGWEATPRSNPKEKQLEGHREAPTYSCRSLWTNFSHLQQQKKVHYMLH